MKIDWIEKCKECKGTGVYVGILEQNSDYGVVCRACKGTGKRHRQFEYEEFKGKEIASVNKVLETNPGIMIAKTSDDMGGIPYQEWYDGKEFPVGSEMRKNTCPAWWFQCADHTKKPKWDECTVGVFSLCKHFPNKHKCWERWDKENEK